MTEYAGKTAERTEPLTDADVWINVAYYGVVADSDTWEITFDDEDGDTIYEFTVTRPVADDVTTQVIGKHAVWVAEVNGATVADVSGY